MEMIGSYCVAAGESKAMTAVVEKPAVEEAPLNLTVVGHYVLPENLGYARIYSSWSR